jgi:UDP-glucose 4-epimerase
MVEASAALEAGQRVLVTGHRGLVGRAVEEALRAAGLIVVGLDLVDGDDVTEPVTVRARMHGCAGVVHLAAVDDAPDQPDPLTPATTGGIDEVMATNVGGTSQLLAAAADAGVNRVVFMSSVDVFGCFMGQGKPRYLPIDDHHPVSPRGPYAWSKLAGEELCAAFTRSTGAATVCLRPPGVFGPETYGFIRSARADRPESEWFPIWEYGAFLDARDLASAVVAALTVPGLSGHHRLVVCADDISSATDDSLTLADRLVPDVPVTARDPFARQPFAALLDSSGARGVLGWRSAHSWRPANSDR